MFDVILQLRVLINSNLLSWYFLLIFVNDVYPTKYPRHKKKIYVQESKTSNEDIIVLYNNLCMYIMFIECFSLDFFFVYRR